MLEIILLSIVQGITEFLPVSSSAHLFLISEYVNLNNENLTIDISLHFGSLLAVIIFFRKEIFNFLKNKSLFLKILLSSLPTLFVGFLLIKLNIINHLRNVQLVAFTTIIFSLLLYYSDKFDEELTISNNFTFKNSLYIGFLQTLSLIPGVSRSGITITGARFLKFSRIESAKISFLLSIPTLGAICIYNFLKIIESKDINIIAQNYLAMFLSFIFSFVTLHFFLKFLKKFNFTFFMFYRLILGTIMFMYAYY